MFRLIIIIFLNPISFTKLKQLKTRLLPVYIVHHRFTNSWGWQSSSKHVSSNRIKHSSILCWWFWVVSNCLPNSSSQTHKKSDSGILCEQDTGAMRDTTILSAVQDPADLEENSNLNVPPSPILYDSHKNIIPLYCVM